MIESPVEAAQAPIDPRHALLLPLWRGRYILLAAVLLGIVGGIFAGVTRPNAYRSFGKLMLRAGQREETTPETSITGGSAGFGMGNRNVVNDELHLLSAPQVFEEVARILTPAEVFRPYDPSAMDDESTSGLMSLFHRWQSWWFRGAPDLGDRPDHTIDECEDCRHLAAMALARNVFLQPEPGSSVITVSYATHDPRLAQKVVSTFIEAAITQHRKIYESSVALEFLNGKVENALKNLTAAEDEFTNFKTGCGVFDFENQQRTLITEIQTLENQTAQDQQRLEVLRDNTENLAALVASLPETIEHRILTNPQLNPELTRLRDRLDTLRDSLAALEGRDSGTSQERDRERNRLTQAIELTKQALQEQPETVDGGPSIQNISNPELGARKTQLADLKIELDGLENAATIRKGQLEDARKRMIDMAQCGPRFQLLAAKSSEARKTYDGFRSQHERTSLMGSMDQFEMSNLRRIQAATLPIEKEGPMRSKLVLLGILLGGVVGCVVAFARNMFDRRLHDAFEVEKLLGTNVLAVISQPKPESKGPRARRHAAL